jgi:hypothetical protein
MPKILLQLFVSAVYDNSFSIKYIHLKSHFFGKKTMKFTIDLLDGEQLYSLVL